MPKGTTLEKIEDALDQIHSLGGIATREEIGGGIADNLLRQGLIERAYIGSYALTEAGEKVRSQSTAQP